MDFKTDEDPRGMLSVYSRQVGLYRGCPGSRDYPDPKGIVLVV